MWPLWKPSSNWASLFTGVQTGRSTLKALRPRLTLKIKLAIRHPTTWSRWTTISKVMSELRDSLQHLSDLRLCLGCSERNINILPPHQSNILSTLTDQKEGKKTHPWTAQFIQQHYQQHQCCSINDFGKLADCQQLSVAVDLGPDGGVTLSDNSGSGSW